MSKTDKVRTHVSLRLPGDVARELREYGLRSGQAAGTIMAQAIREWLRMNAHPGIDFRWTPSGRRPHVTGTGMKVSEFRMILRDFKGDARRILRAYPHVKSEHLEAARRYLAAHAGEFPDEPEPPGWVPRVGV